MTIQTPNQKRKIPLSVPSLRGRELELVAEAVKSEWVSTAGTFVNAFEDNIAKYVDAPGAVACQSGTAAIHIALILAGVRENDEVIAPTITFIAPVNAIRYVNAHPVFMDCDQYLCMDVEKVRKFLELECSLDKDGYTRNKSTGRRIAAIMPVHIFGNVVDMPPLLELAKRWNLKVIEDATESLGTFWTSGPLAGRHAGTVGDFGAYSFNGNKIITTGGGGMLITKDAELTRKARYLTTQAKDDALRYIHDEVGFNYRMTNLQAALGVAQLEQIEKFIVRKKDIFSTYASHLGSSVGGGMKVIPFRTDIRPNYWLCALKLSGSGIEHRESLMTYLNAAGIETRPLWFPNHLQKPYAGCQAFNIEAAIEYHASTLNIPSSAGITADDLIYVCQKIQEARECQ